MRMYYRNATYGCQGISGLKEVMTEVSVDMEVATMVEQSNNKTLEKRLGGTQTKPAIATIIIAAVVDAIMKKLVQMLQKMSIYKVGPPSLSFAQPSDQNLSHTPPPSDTWAHLPPPFYLIVHPNLFYSSSAIQRSYPSGHLQPHASPMPSDYGQPPQKLLDLSIRMPLSVDLLHQPFNGTDGIHNRSRIEVGESLAHFEPTELPMYSKNLIILLSNVPSNYITNYVAFSARSLTHDNEKNSGKPILICMPQSLGLTSVNGKNPWILDSGATDHLTGFLEHFVSYTLYVDNEKI
ncbi:uncharacterized protein E5676_scaffold14G00310 [Cucumis melo var. makuwa]|uniref:Kirola-like n=1 Tax=Cucumis melo var. makuwa TaxID=1194695 RepID=A0A5D3DS78_CUCMM|nr:uncharacterized protein E6C27_scaffold38G00670 [Cucumis melo var. makuwa]TYK26265.1 uncharacterized protein E5676_scaffold14G00310 [Cucumis melo var. makuwa]